MTWEIIFLNNHTQNVVEKLVPNPCIKNQNLAHLWISSLKYNKLCFDCMPRSSSTQYIITKVQAFSKNKKRFGTNLSTFPA